MGFLKRLFQREPQETPQKFEKPWDAVEAFIRDPRWQVELLEEQANWVKIRYDGLVGELFRDPEERWLQIRFRHAMTEAQKASELEMYVGWSEHCAQHTLFRWDIDTETQEYYGDAFALFEYQGDAIGCIRQAFNSAILFDGKSNDIAPRGGFSLYVGRKNRMSVALCLWTWLGNSQALKNIKPDKSSWSERSYWMGTVLASVKQEQWLYYGVIRFGTNDFMPYMQSTDERRLMLYKMHLGIQRWFPRMRNFVIMVPERPTVNGTHEMSMAIMGSNGTHMEPILDKCVEEAYRSVWEYTEWFMYDFNAETAPWFDHSKKELEKDYKREFQPRPFPDSERYSMKN